MKKNRNYDRFAQYLEDAGCRIRRTQDGWHILFPNGKGTSMHKTPSDPRSFRNLRSQIRRAGIEWPSWMDL